MNTPETKTGVGCDDWLGRWRQPLSYLCLFVIAGLSYWRGLMDGHRDEQRHHRCQTYFLEGYYEGKKDTLDAIISTNYISGPLVISNDNVTVNLTNTVFIVMDGAGINIGNVTNVSISGGNFHCTSIDPGFWFAEDRCPTCRRERAP